MNHFRACGVFCSTLARLVRVATFPHISTLTEIERAVAILPRKDQESLLRHLLARLGPGPSCYDLSRELFEEPGRIGASGKHDLSTNKAHLASLGRKRNAR